MLSPSQFFQKIIAKMRCLGDNSNNKWRKCCCCTFPIFHSPTLSIKCPRTRRCPNMHSPNTDHKKRNPTRHIPRTESLSHPSFTYSQNSLCPSSPELSYRLWQNSTPPHCCPVIIAPCTAAASASVSSTPFQIFTIADANASFGSQAR